MVKAENATAPISCRSAAPDWLRWAWRWWWKRWRRRISGSCAHKFASLAASGWNLHRETLQKMWWEGKRRQIIPEGPLNQELFNAWKTTDSNFRMKELITEPYNYMNTIIRDEHSQKIFVFTPVCCVTASRLKCWLEFWNNTQMGLAPDWHIKRCSSNQQPPEQRCSVPAASSEERAKAVGPEQSVLLIF